MRCDALRGVAHDVKYNKVGHEIKDAKADELEVGEEGWRRRHTGRRLDGGRLLGRRHFLHPRRSTMQMPNSSLVDRQQGKSNGYIGFQHRFQLV